MFGERKTAAVVQENMAPGGTSDGGAVDSALWWCEDALTPTDAAHSTVAWRHDGHSNTFSVHFCDLVSLTT